MSAEISSIKIWKIVNHSSFQTESVSCTGNFTIEETDGLWKILDAQKNVVYTGALADCQQWLDRSENTTENSGFWSLIRSVLLESK